MSRTSALMGGPGATAAESAPEPLDVSLNLVTVADGLTVPEAELMQAILRQGGIASVLRDFYTIWANWFLMDALGGVKVQVAERDLTAALELLNQPPEAFPALEPDSDPPHDDAGVTLDAGPPCPCCGSAADSSPDPEPGAFLVELVRSLVPLPTPHQRWICPRVWQALDRVRGTSQRL